MWKKRMEGLKSSGIVDSRSFPVNIPNDAFKSVPWRKVVKQIKSAIWFKDMLTNENIALRSL
jgi:hypothetical protein